MNFELTFQFEQIFINVFTNQMNSVLYLPRGHKKFCKFFVSALTGNLNRLLIRIVSKELKFKYHFYIERKL